MRKIWVYVKFQIFKFWREYYKCFKINKNKCKVESEKKYKKRLIEVSCVQEGKIFFSLGDQGLGYGGLVFEWGCKNG